ncbi:MAG: glutamate--tRNA ligase [Christensenellaceae bacterium]|jgi:glutamyl-tRNA synthetase|nr:glutamate--tRNA ligase [Christensenellaceae bacterium]
MSKELANLLFPDIKETPEDYFKIYPKRKTPATRIAPSPTGYMHLGTLGMTVVDKALANALGGVCLFRVEDTDNKREVKDATKRLIEAFKVFGISFDEGFDGEKDYGAYAPYIQSRRVPIYKAFAKRLVEEGKAYPCFCSEEKLAEQHENQVKSGDKTGYYGKYASCKNLTLDEVKENLAQGKPWALRANFDLFNPSDRIAWCDGVRGEMSLPVETNNVVILKSNRIPPYNLAHVVDDTLMGISHVVRGEEWLISTAQHLQLFKLLGLTPPTYLHMPVICVQEGESKRKLSKRKDKEALVENLLKEGYPTEAILEYLMTIYNTDFEIWRIKNPTAPRDEFKFKIEKIGSNNPLLDMPKLDNISKNIIGAYSNAQTKLAVINFFGENLPNLDKVLAVCAIDRETPKPRKDIVKFSDILTLYDYIFDDFVAPRAEGEGAKILARYAELYSAADDKTAWFEKMKRVAREFGFADNGKDFKANPEQYKGSIADISQIIRKKITGKENTPDLYEISRILGEQTVKARLRA